MGTFGIPDLFGGNSQNPTDMFNFSAATAPSPRSAAPTPNFSFGNPTMTSSAAVAPTPPGVVPPQSMAPSSTYPFYGNPMGFNAPPGTPNIKYPGTGAVHNLGHGFYGVPPAFPSMQADLAQLLTGQLGQGTTPFDLSAVLPTGGTTTPGSLSAPLNPQMQQLMQYFLTGQGGNAPGLNTMSQLSSTGLPTDVMPEWQAMIAAQQQNIQQNEANLKEQFAATGGLGGSPYGTAVSNYEQQTTKDQNALLGQLTAQSLEAARGRQAGAAEQLFTGGQDFSSVLQNLDQNSINAMLQEYIRTSPQYNPLLSMMYGQANTFDPTLSANYGLGGTGAILQGLGSIAGAGASIYSTAKGGG